MTRFRISEAGLPRVVCVLALCSMLGAMLFFHLGHYALSQHEADTGLFAQSVGKHGYPGAWLGNNLIAEHQGNDLTDGVNLAASPGAYYLAAPFIRVLGPTALAARLPFAALGLLTGMLVLYWLVVRGASTEVVLMVGLGMATHAAFLLYMRQAQSHAPVVFLSVLALMCYDYRERPQAMFGLTASLLLLLFFNHIAYGAFTVGLIVDYVLWGHREQPALGLETALCLMAQGLAVGLSLQLLHLPQVALPTGDEAPWIWSKLYLLWWTLRDMNRCEFGVPALLLLAPLFYLLRARDVVWVRLPAAMVVYTLVACVMSPQPVGLGAVEVADLSHVVLLIPGFLWLTIEVLTTVSQRVLRYGLAAVLLFSNTAQVLTAPLWQDAMRPVQCTWMQFVHELKAPHDDALRSTASWLKRNVAPQESVAVLPAAATYPLMYLAAAPTYAWQLSAPAPPEYYGVADIQVAYAEAPDFFVTMGPSETHLAPTLNYLHERFHVNYRSVATLSSHVRAFDEPQLLWHAFTQSAIGPLGVDQVMVWVKEQEPAVANADNGGPH